MLAYCDYYRAPQTVFSGEGFMLEIQIRATYAPKITWKHNGEILASSDHCQIQSTETLTTLGIPETVSTDEGLYVVRAENDYGFYESTFSLIVFGMILFHLIGTEKISF